MGWGPLERSRREYSIRINVHSIQTYRTHIILTQCKSFFNHQGGIGTCNIALDRTWLNQLAARVKILLCQIVFLANVKWWLLKQVSVWYHLLVARSFSVAITAAALNIGTASCTLWFGFDRVERIKSNLLLYNRRQQRTIGMISSEKTWTVCSN